MSEPKLYATRDTEALGEFYLRHVDAMTCEDLHSKAAIAAELAWRDAEIRRIRVTLQDSTCLLESLAGASGEGEEQIRGQMRDNLAALVPTTTGETHEAK